jgi:hypothetical protein
MLRKFSIVNHERQKRKSLDKNFRGNDSRLSVVPNQLSGDVTNYLLSLGFELNQIVIAHKIYNFSTIEEAVNIMMIDHESEKYLHKFFKVKERKDICAICQDELQKHLYFDDQDDVGDYAQTLRVKETEMISNKTLPSVRDTRLMMQSNQINVKPKYVNINLPPEEEFEDINLCRICFSTKMQEGINKVSSNCGHEFCKNCVQTYLQTNIMNGRVLSIPCLYGGCEKRFSDEEVKNLVSEEIWKKYKIFKYQQLPLRQKDKNMVSCPFPDCIEAVEVNIEEKNSMLQCTERHKFCSNCKTLGWHKPGKCSEVNNFFKL